MVLAIDASSPTVVTQATGTITTLSTGSFTPPDNSDLLIMWSGNTVDPNNPATPTITDSLGVPLSYTLKQWMSHADSPNPNGQTALWTAHVVTGAAMTITVTSGAASPNRHAALKVIVFTGADQATPFGVSGKAGSKSAASIAQTYTATRTNSWGFIAVTDWTVVGVPTAGSGMTLINAAGVGAPDIDYGFFRRTIQDGVNGGTTTLNVSLPGTSTDLTWCYIEVLPDQGQIAPAPQPAPLPPFLLYYILAAKQQKLLLDSANAIPDQNLTLSGIASEERYGEAVLNPGTVNAPTFGTQTEERFGAVTVTPGSVTIAATGIASEEREGQPSVFTAVTVSATAISSAETIGEPQAQPGAVTVSATGVASEQLLGEPSVGFPSTGAIAFDSSGSTSMTAGATSSSINISSAAVGADCYAWIALGPAPSGTVTITGWTDVVTQVDDGTSVHYALLHRTKQSGDTSFTVSWTNSAKGTLSWASWTGLDTTTPHEGASLTTNGSTSRTAVPTPSATPTAANRWAAGFFSARTSTPANKPITWTPDAALTERIDVDNNLAGSAPWIGNEIADSNTAVTQTSHSYTGTHNAAESHDGSAILFLIPGAGAATQNITASGIPGEELIGAPALSSSITVTQTGIASEERTGSAQVQSIIAAAGIQSQEREGAATVTSVATIQGTAISSQESSGLANVAAGAVTVQATGIASEERHGQSSTTVGAVQISATGIASGQAVGEPAVSSTATIQASGIASAETSGLSQTFLTQTISAASISPSESFGSARLDLQLQASAVPSEERFGQPVTTLFVSASGIQSEERLGSPVVLLAQTISATSIQSQERVGAATATPGPATIAASGIASEQQLGSAQSFGSVVVSATSITSFETFGEPSIIIAQSIVATGIGSESASGVAQAIPGPTTVQASGVSSADAVGFASASTASIVSASSIVTGETFGEPTLSVITAINAFGIPSENQLGEPAIAAIATIQARGIVSETALGAANLALLIRGHGIPSQETFGKLSITVGAVTISAYGIVSGERHGRITVTAIPVVAPEPDTKIELKLGQTTIKVTLGNTTLQLKNALTRIRVVGGQSVIELTADDVTVSD
jgi:hypothetical protein